MRRFGLIGKTLSHSFSKKYFTRKFSEAGLQDCSYENFELSQIAELETVVKTAGLKGLNVTIPYKEAVLPFLEEKSEAVQSIGACNCIKVRRGRLEGYNTDAPAFQHTLEALLQPVHRKALVLGTGGASKAVRFALTRLSIPFTLVSRISAADTIVYEEVSGDLMQEHTIVINTTPLGTFPNVDEQPPLPYEAVGQHHLFYDLVYNPEKTRFLQSGEAAGATIMNGYAMLVAQAEESWRIWNS